jgi:DHA1 family tetracycline resistance protein-like MFS transporter
MAGSAGASTDTTMSRQDRLTVWMMYFEAVLSNVGFTILVPGLPFIISEMGVGAYGMGAVMSSFSVGRLIGCWLAGSLSDRIGGKRVIMISCAITSIAYVGIAFAPNIEVLIACRTLQGLSAGNVAVLQAMMMDIVPKEQGATYQGYLLSVTFAATTVGPAVGGFLGKLFGFTGSCLVSGVCSAIACVFTAYLMTSPQKRQEVEDDCVESSLEGAKEAGGSTSAHGVALQCLPACIASALFCVGLATAESQGVLYYTEILNMGKVQLAFLFTFQGVCSSIVCTWAVGPLTARLGSVSVHKFGCIVAAIGFIAMGFISKQWMLYAATTLASLGNVSMIARVNIISDVCPSSRRGSMMGMLNAFSSCGRILGPILAAPIYKEAPQAIWALVAAAMIMAVLVPLRGSAAKDSEADLELGRRASRRLPRVVIACALLHTEGDFGNLRDRRCRAAKSRALTTCPSRARAPARERAASCPAALKLYSV